MADNYSKTMFQAESLASLANSLSGEIQRLEGIRSRLRTDWQGLAADEFRNQLAKLIYDLRKIENEIKCISNAVKNAAN